MEIFEESHTQEEDIEKKGVPDARLDDASTSVVEREELGQIEDEQTEPPTTAKTERSEKHDLFLISDRLSKSSASSRQSFGVDITAIHGLNGDACKT